MKRGLLFLFLSIFICSCARNNETKNAKVAEDNVSEAAEVTADLIKEATLQQLTEQKLQEYAELLALKNTHPEFEAATNAQLEKLSRDSIIDIATFENLGTIKVTDLGKNFKISEAIEKFKVHFEMNSGSKITRDSIYGYLLKKEIALDNKWQVLTEIRFAKE